MAPERSPQTTPAKNKTAGRKLMSEEKKYLDDQWDDLPIPGSEISWQKMELLLDKEEKRRRVIPFWFWRYAGVGLLLMGVVIGGWFLLYSKNKSTQKADSKQENIQQVNKKQKDVVAANPERRFAPQQKSSHSKEKAFENGTEQNEKVQKDITLQNRTAAIQHVHSKKKDNTDSRNKASQKRKPSIIKDERDDELLTGNDKSQQVIITNNNIVQKQVDSLKEATIKIKKDSIPVKDSISVLPVVATDAKKEGRKKRPAFIWSAGVGLQQSIAFNGQQSSSYNYRGNRSALADHIPSVYLRLQRGKWFAQAEVNYSVPQPVEHFSFSQITRYDAAAFTLNTERFFIQKLYYHQLPFSINYSILPNWSVGAGGMYNLLAGAVTEQELLRRNVLTGAEATTKSLVPVKGYKDSFLYKSTAGILVQTDYQWKRLSVGLRYQKNLQPYIKYTKPSGEILDEKNSALQAILRFQLWKSRAK
jgi:hypothetical protein